MKINRPLSPHLTIYKPQLTSILSIFHRISGGFLAFFILFGIFCLKYCDVNMSNFLAYTFFFYFISRIDWFLFSLFNIALLAFCYHVTNGIRHVLWDLGFFLDLSKVYTTGAITITFSILLFLIINLVRVFF